MYPQAYIDYLVHFHGDRDYFECHEVLEEYWKEDERGKRKIYWVAFIQIAVSLYHQRRGNFSGSLRMMKNALSIIKNEKEAIKMLGLYYEQLIEVLEMRVEEIKSLQPYTSMFLPIQDESLLNECEVHCQKRGIVWGNSSNLSDTYLINKHTLRDRDEVIEEREKQKVLKRRILD
jgi:predicted metal-dependent hydrolase